MLSGTSEYKHNQNFKKGITNIYLIDEHEMQRMETLHLKEKRPIET